MHLGLSSTTCTTSSSSSSSNRNASSGCVGQTPATLNNAGLSCIATRDFQSALRHLRAALGAVAQNTATSAAPRNEQNHPVLPFTPVTDLTHQVLLFTNSVMNKNCFIHAVGIYVNDVPFYYHQDELANTTVVSSIILYNLALLFHLKSLEGSCGAREHSLKTALSLYQRSKFILEESGLMVRSSVESSNGLFGKQGLSNNGMVYNPPIYEFLFTALLNNLSACCFRNAEFPMAQTYANQLHQLIHFQENQVRPSNLNQETIVLLEWNRSVCFTNVLVLKTSKLAPAA